jgi:hypothetical protein
MVTTLFSKLNEMALLPISFLILCLFIGNISCHGRLMDPPNRSSLWRVNPDAPPNYTDDQNNCGGKPVSTSDLIIYLQHFIFVYFQGTMGGLRR